MLRTKKKQTPKRIKTHRYTSISNTINASNPVFYPLFSYIPADDGVKMKESENIDTYLYLARKKNKLLNMKLTVMIIIIGTLVTVLKKRLLDEKSVEDSRYYRTHHWWDQQECWKESWRPKKTCCYSDSSETYYCVTYWKVISLWPSA